MEGYDLHKAQIGVAKALLLNIKRAQKSYTFKNIISKLRYVLEDIWMLLKQELK